MAYIDLELVKRGGNRAIEINPPTGADFHITEHGSAWLWSAFCVFIVIGLVIIGLMFRKPANERVFYFTSILPTMFMALAYFTMASDLGWAPIRAEFNHVKTDTQDEFPGYRQVFYAKYIGWFLSFPFHVINLGFLSRTPWGQIAFNVCFTEMYVVMLLIASLVSSTYKWGFYVLAIGALIFVTVSTFVTSGRLADKVGKDCHAYFHIAAGILTVLWFIYPICFGVSEGGNDLQPDSETIFYGVLDVVVFGFYSLAFLLATNDFTLERLGLLTPEFEVIPHEKSGLSVAGRASGETAVSRSASGVTSPSAASPRP
ncbi:opsin family protein [Flavobacterium sp. LB2P84]|uniref:Uncharacterized protein n=1 Tax=Wickerhamomyces anomalus (strain ATCC 58044 / CBS 1984 / NCYC 433 / NRRL Y-366-8) TaxID=683960 RepID=A0A1E3P4W1_WICAA|nr:opsin family protein [Flavobacterium yafengii]XP_019039610.1 uncharacterized protein WICANDRAFT_92819 [Wickerhamomyces anomalus NRRL Y-366-8]MDI5889466.1 opsin family protein [Flavobacterium yafengii]MDI6034858.1 opsin family protein [Flavobacterium yafengii]MDI6048195.1 opsin family protein [Flavobacterium yafengii]ODQ60403.1 hypothetical protein WICANDRAFT_92819 [Wickerhamomyces anomalus NRRL Y-366-8]